MAAITNPLWDHGQRRTVLVQSLLAEIFEGTLRAGQHLVGQELADRYNVSQTPIREALITLAGIGVVDLLPNRGAIVRPVTRQDIHEVCQLRLLLEREATRTACGKIPVDSLQTLRSQMETVLTSPPTHEILIQAQTVDSRFHDLIALHCGNRLLAREIGRLKLLFRAYRDVSWQQVEKQRDFTRLPLEAREHLAVIDALQKEDREAAARAMSTHIRSGERYWTRLIPVTVPLTPPILSQTPKTERVALKPKKGQT